MTYSTCIYIYIMSISFAITQATFHWRCTAIVRRDTTTMLRACGNDFAVHVAIVSSDFRILTKSSRASTHVAFPHLLASSNLGLNTLTWQCGSVKPNWRHLVTNTHKSKLIADGNMPGLTLPPFKDTCWQWAELVNSMPRASHALAIKFPIPHSRIGRFAGIVWD